MIAASSAMTLVRDHEATVRAALSSRSAEAGKPEVKALEWARNGNRHDAGSIVGRYTIEGRNPGYGLLVPAPVAVRLFIDLEAAKAAAQSDYESRFLSALAAPVADSVPVSSPTYAEITEPYRAALRMIREAIETIFGPTANLESEEAELLRGPEPHHTAEAVISALQNIAAKIEPVSVPDGVELAARFVEKRLNDYVQEHGAYDNSTGATEFPGNGDEYVYELEEIIEGIRALATASHSSKTEEVGPVVTDEMVN